MRGEHAFVAMRCIIGRELLRFAQQRGRFLAAMVRPLIWLAVFAAGFRATLGLSIIPPYQTYISYEVYIVPGLIGMIQLFNGMQSSLSMVYDEEMGSMRVLLSSPLPRWFLLLCKLVAGVIVSLVQAGLFLAAGLLLGVDLPAAGFIMLVPALIITGLMLGGLGMLLASTIRQLENFASVMNFVIFPMFFVSSALYPIWKMRESSPFLATLCQWNPFTHAVELIRFTLYGEVNILALAVVLGSGAGFFLIAVWAFDPARKFRAGKTS